MLFPRYADKKYVAGEQCARPVDGVITECWAAKEQEPTFRCTGCIFENRSDEDDECGYTTCENIIWVHADDYAVLKLLGKT